MEKRPLLYLVEGGKAHKVPVTVGVDDGKMAEITEGLKPGAQVVLGGGTTWWTAPR